MDRARARRRGTPRTARVPRVMALNREFYADCFARSAVGRFDRARAPVAAKPFAAAAKKEFDLTSFLKDLAAVRALDAISTDARATARARRFVRDGWTRNGRAREVARASRTAMVATHAARSRRSGGAR